MSFKNKIYLIEILIIFSLVVFLNLFYNTYITQKEKDLESNIQTIVQNNKFFIKQSLKTIYTNHRSNEKLFYKIHQYAQNKFFQNPSMPIQKLKEDVIKAFNLKDFDIDIFLIDKSYTITDATFERDIGFNLGIIEDAKHYLDKTKEDSKIYVASNISIDMLEYQLKVYSYGKIDDNRFFEMGFKFDNFFFKELKENLEDIYKTTNNKVSLYRVIETSDNQYQYYNDLLNKPKDNISKEEYKKRVKQFDKNKPTDDKFINTIRQNRIQKEIVGDRYIVYVPLLKKEESEHLFYNNLVLKVDIDISSHLQSLEETKENFYVLVFILALFLLTLYYLIKFNFYKPIMKIVSEFESEKRVDDTQLNNKKDEIGILVKKYNSLFDKLNKEIEKNRLILTENKRFIADTVHQIKTPLSVIMMNSELLNTYIDNVKAEEFIEEINASINLLTNSYEDLSFVVSNDTIYYKPSKLSLSNIVKERIAFFNSIAKANSKTIKSNIEENIYGFINHTEIERLIDNNLSNAVKYAKTDTEIEIELSKKSSEIFLSFTSVGENIKNPSKLFDRNYRENNEKRGLGLGLNIVKTVCEKYGTSYGVSFKNGKNSFLYAFKNDLES